MILLHMLPLEFHNLYSLKEVGSDLISYVFEES